MAAAQRLGWSFGDIPAAAPRPRAQLPAARPSAGTTGGNAVAQRLIKGYKPGKLRSNYNVMKGLTSQQAAKIQLLHDSSDPYSINEAREAVGAEPLKEKSSGSGAPFPWRYSGASDYMKPAMSGPSAMPRLMHT